MKYEKSLFLSVFVILLSGITACNELEDVSRTVTGVTVKLPDDLSDSERYPYFPEHIQWIVCKSAGYRETGIASGIIQLFL